MAVLGAGKEVMANWSELPSDMLQLISKKLSDLYDFIYFCAVCKNWRSSVAISDVPPLLPWLAIIPFPYRRIEENSHFYSLSSQKFFTVPGFPTNTFHSSSLPYLLLWSQIDHVLYALFNPITNHVVHLPPIKRDWYDAVHSDGDSVLICTQSTDWQDLLCQSVVGNLGMQNGI